MYRDFFLSFNIESMKKNLFYCILAAGSLMAVSCSPTDKGTRKLFVISSGEMKIDKANPQTIQFEPSGQHNEEELSFDGKEKVTVTVAMKDGNKTFELPDEGTYLLNLKSDTVIGSAVNYGNSGVPAKIDEAEVTRIIDSTQQLMAGKNASDTDKSFWLPPYTIHKISANNKAVILSPYKNIPYKIEVDEKGNAPEMYKFFTNTQKREALNDMIKRLGN